MPTPGNRHHLRGCPTCREKLIHPNVCWRGHLICNNCRGSFCALCSEVHCINSQLGCTKEGTPLEMKKHEVECYYRWIRCAWHLQCGKHEIPLCKYKDHLEEVHKPYIKRIRLNEEYDITLNTDHNGLVRTKTVLRIEGTGTYFVRRCLLDLEQDLLLICLHYIGENEDAKNYIYRLRIDQGLNHAEYACTSYCLPYVDNLNFSMTFPKLRPSKIFLTKDYLHEINYSMIIKKLT